MTASKNEAYLSVQSSSHFESTFAKLKKITPPKKSFSNCSLKYPLVFLHLKIDTIFITSFLTSGSAPLSNNNATNSSWLFSAATWK